MNTDYVVRATVRAPNGHAAYEVVDMAGARVWVTIPRALSTDDGADPIIRARLASRARPHRPL